MTYDIMGIGWHNSSFSPEDLCSNFLGTRIAARAIALGGDFNTAVTKMLNNLLTFLDAQTKAESLNAFNLINGRWVDFKNVKSLREDGYLKRRNFTRFPWKAGHSSDKPTPDVVTKGLGDAGTFYNYSHTVGRTIPMSDFLKKEVARIRKDAEQRYGSGYDKP